MKVGPNIASIAALIGDPARANMLTALMSGKALTATELSQEAGVSLQTASSHLKQLSQGGLLQLYKQGRHKYFSLANDDVGEVLEKLMCLAETSGHTRTRTGPRNEALRKARACYNHLAGHMGVQMYDSFIERGFLKLSDQGLMLTQPGEEFVSTLGVDVADLQRKRAPMCRECLDWSERRPHLAGSLGRAVFTRIEQFGWAKRMHDSRIVQFTRNGEKQFNQTFPVPKVY